MGTSAAGAVRFFRHDIWEMPLEGEKRVRAFFLRGLRVLLLALEGFRSHGCSNIASSLTYYSLLNLVPVLAVAFAVGKGFGLQKSIEAGLLHLAAGAGWKAEATNQIIAFSQSLLQHTRGGLIAGAGVILLFWTVVSIFQKIEAALNTIWGVGVSRSLTKRFSDYLTIMVLAPILFVISSSLNVLVAGTMQRFIFEHSALQPFAGTIVFLMNALSYLSIGLLLMIVYMVLPNARVRVGPAVLGGAVAGAIYLVVQWLYIRFQIGIASYGAIYGSFAALPLLLVWLRMGWMIILFGAEIARASEHYETYGFNPDYGSMGEAMRKKLLLTVFRLVVRRFDRGEEPPTAAEISHEARIPLRLVEEMLSALGEAGLVAKVERKDTDLPAFHPSRSVDEMTIEQVLDRYERRDEALDGPGRDDQIVARLRQIAADAEKSPGNVRLKDI